MKNPVDEFLELDKNAASWGEFGGQLALGAGVAAVGALANEVYRGVSNAVGRSRGFKSMMAYNPSLEKEDRVRVQNLYNTLHNVSPDLARDPLVANSWVKRMMYQDEYVDPRTMSDLAAAQQRIGQSRGYGLDFQSAGMEALKGASPFIQDKKRRGSPDDQQQEQRQQGGVGPNMRNQRP